MAKTFAGTTINLPGVYTSADVSAFTPPTTGGVVNIGIVGPATGGVPQKVYRFTSYAAAANVLKSGELLDLIRLAFNPGGAVGASVVYAVRVAGTGVSQASLTSGSLIIKSRDYGSSGNYIQVGISNGTSVGKRIDVYDVVRQEREIFDNLGPVFAIKYTGNGASCDLEITHVEGKARFLTITPKDSNGDPILSEVITVDFTNPSFSTVGQLLNYLASFAYLTVYRSPFLTDTNFPTTLLDKTTSPLNIKTSEQTITAVAGICYYIINKNSELVEAEFGDSNYTAPSNTPLTFLSGGVDGSSPTASDYQNALDLLGGHDVQIVCVASGDSTIHNLVANHVNDASSVTGKRERIAFLGLSNPAATKADYIAAAIPFSNSYRIVMCAPGIVEVVNGVPVERPSYYTAALLAGLKAGLALQENITYKVVGVAGLTKNFSIQDITDLLNSGVTVIEEDEVGVYRVVKGVTTYRSDDNLAKQEISAVLIIDNISKTIRRALEKQFLGRAFTASIANEIAAAVGYVLSTFAERGALIGNPPYRNIVVDVTNDTVRVSYEASPATVANYIFVSQVFTPAFGW